LRDPTDGAIARLSADVQSLAANLPGTPEERFAVDAATEGATGLDVTGPGPTESLPTSG